ncbi:flagellar assembly protein FliH [Agarivorans sp. Z349TD_8]|uniref:flagellar assembly protein FliH n=1 Tax=Agarivorans sp. Z349TD_8 TaxID=3421434 RepID=UPI003D7EB7E1
MTEQDKSESTDEHDSEVKQDASQSSMDDDEIAALLAETQGSPVEVADQESQAMIDDVLADTSVGPEPDDIVWPLPNFSDAEHRQHGQSSNAYGVKPSWVDQPEPEVEPEIQFEPMTIEELEALRQSAYDEGFAEGKLAGHEAGLLSGHEEGLAKGLEAGQQQGLSQGLTEGQQQIDELSAHWAGLVGQLHQPKAQIDAEVEQQIVDLAMKLAAEIVQVELQTNPEIIVKTVKQAVAALPLQQQSIQIHLHPLDLAIVEQVFPPETQQKKGWQLLTDGSLTQGDCLIENDLSSVTVEMSEVIQQSLRSFIRQNGQDDDSDPTA